MGVNPHAAHFMRGGVGDETQRRCRQADLDPLLQQVVVHDFEKFRAAWRTVGPRVSCAGVEARNIDHRGVIKSIRARQWIIGADLAAVRVAAFFAQRVFFDRIGDHRVIDLAEARGRSRLGVRTFRSRARAERHRVCVRRWWSSGREKPVRDRARCALHRTSRSTGRREPSIFRSAGFLAPACAALSAAMPPARPDSDDDHVVGFIEFRDCHYREPRCHRGAQ